MGSRDGTVTSVNKKYLLIPIWEDTQFKSSLIFSQVSSRVQKYFIKLARAGLPIPGRPPHMGGHKKVIQLITKLSIWARLLARFWNLVNIELNQRIIQSSDLL